MCVCIGWCANQVTLRNARCNDEVSFLTLRIVLRACLANTPDYVVETPTAHYDEEYCVDWEVLEIANIRK